LEITQFPEQLGARCRGVSLSYYCIIALPIEKGGPLKINKRASGINLGNNAWAQIAESDDKPSPQGIGSE
jgi:hypothetical protein